MFSPLWSDSLSDLKVDFRTFQNYCEHKSLFQFSNYVTSKTVDCLLCSSFKGNKK